MDNFVHLPEDAVVSLNFSHPLLEQRTFKVSEFSKAGFDRVQSVVKTVIPTDKCEVLSPGYETWKKGSFRYRVIIEFCPDE